MEKNSQNNVLLVDIKSIDIQQLNLTLREVGCRGIAISKEEYKKQGNHSLIIVDAKSDSNRVITHLKNEQHALFLQPEYHPPILAIVDVVISNKEQVFQLGAFDYISSPLIIDELKNRIRQAIHLYRIMQSSLLQSAHLKQGSDNNGDAFVEVNPSGKKNNIEYILAEKTASYLKSQLASDITLDDLARKMTTNRNKLSRAFKTYFGTTVFNWLREQRMLYAVELLDTTSHSILQIAEQVGYPDSNNFSTAFKRVFKLPPNQYRKVQQTKNTVQTTKVKTESVQVD